MYDLTVIIPAYREEENIRHIITKVDAVLKFNNLNGEILVADVDSPNIVLVANEVKKINPQISSIDPVGDYVCSKSIADGFTRASSDILLVIDSDPSFNFELIPVMYKEIIRGYDIVIGSRYMDGVGVQKMSLKKRAIALESTFLGRLLFPDLSDPVSCFFAVRKSIVVKVPLKPHCHNILLEVLGKGTWEKCTEILIEFPDMQTCSGKEKLKKCIAYVLQVTDITLFSVLHHKSAAWREWKNVIKYGLVGLSGIFVNMGVLILLKEYAGFSIPLASFFAIELSILSNFLLNDNWTFRDSGNHKLSKWWHRFVSFQFVSVGGSLINFATLNLLTFLMGVDYRVANVIGILIGFGWNFLLNRRLTWKQA